MLALPASDDPLEQQKLEFLYEWGIDVTTTPKPMPTPIPLTKAKNPPPLPSSLNSHQHSNGNNINNIAKNRHNTTRQKEDEEQRYHQFHHLHRPGARCSRTHFDTKTQKQTIDTLTSPLSSREPTPTHQMFNKKNYDTVYQ